jgi:hypothetical protein
MPVFLLTDADRFPFDAEDRSAMAAAGVELRELAGHEPEEVVAAAQGADAIFVYYARFPPETIARLDGVRVLARCGTGYDNIDVAAARERGMEVVYVPDYGIDDVADHALALIGACALASGRDTGSSDRCSVFAGARSACSATAASADASGRRARRSACGCSRTIRTSPRRARHAASSSAKRTSSRSTHR